MESRGQNFKHLKNTASPNCSLFIAGYHADVISYVSRKAFKLRQPKLYLEIASAKPGADWTLMLLIPKFQNARSLRLGDYSPNQGDFRIEDIPDGGRLCPVAPNADPYDFQLYLENNNSETVSVDGLSELAVFNAGQGMSRRLPEEEALEWGQIIIVLKRAAFEVTDIPRQVAFRHLKTKDDWRSLMLCLPKRPHQDVTAWVYAKFGRKIIDSSTKIEVAFPISGILSPDGTWTISREHDHVVVAVQHPEPLRYPLRLEILSDSGDCEQRHALKVGRQTHFIDFGRLTPGFYQIRLESTSSPILDLSVTIDNEELNSHNVAFIFQIDARYETVMLWDMKLSSHFFGVKSLKEDLVDILLPNFGEIRATCFTGKTQQAVRFELSVEAAMETKTQLLKLIKDWVKQPKGRFSLDAGGYGRVTFPDEKACSKQKTLAIKRDPHTVARMQWLLLASNNHPKNIKFNAQNSRSVTSNNARSLYPAHTRQLGLS